VLLMDLDLAGSDGLELLPQVLKIAPLRVLVLTAAEDPARLCKAVELGAKGVLHKSEPPKQILEAIELVRQGGAWLHPQLLSQVLGRLTGPQTQAATSSPAPRTALEKLTARELGIVQALSQSPGDKLLSVAQRLGMSENTLRNHLTAVYGKLGVRGRLELHLFAAEQGLTKD
jgi:two-component system, NarL family, nitrate/nitrite response regulator NarL